MDTTPQILVVGSDNTLRREFEAAVGALRNWRPILHFAPNRREGIEAARSRRPELVCVQLDGDPRSLKTFAEEVRAGAAETAVVALYRPENMGLGDAEHTIFIEAMRAQVEDFLGRPLATPELQQLLDRVLRREKGARRELGRVVSFVSNKGGVGKSTLSVNVACALAKRHPGEVLLVDASLHLGSCAPMLDLSPTTSVASAARECHRLDETLLRRLAARHAGGLDVLAAPVDAVDASEVDDESLARILTLARRAWRFVIVDTFPMLDGLILAILDLSDRAFVVVQNTVPNVIGAARLLPVLDQVGFPKERERIVLNNNFERVPGGLSTEDVERKLGREVHYVVPYQKKLVTALNTGRPHVLNSNRLFGFSRVVWRIADELGGLVDAPVPAAVAEASAPAAPAVEPREPESHGLRAPFAEGRASA